MIEVKILNKQNIQTFGTTLNDQSELSNWLELIGEAKGKPERWVLAKKLMDNGNPEEPEHWMWHSEYYEESDVLKTEIRVNHETGKSETMVLLKADYTIEIIDLEKDYDYLLQQCYENRKKEYGALEKQLAEIYDDFDKWRDRITEIKQKIPKPTLK